MLDAGGAVQAALRPAVLISVVRVRAITYTLDGSASAAATRCAQHRQLRVERAP